MKKTNDFQIAIKSIKTDAVVFAHFIFFQTKVQPQGVA